MGNKQTSLKLLINKKTDRVLFAESEKEFVDILLSFLTLPMGTIIRLLGKESSVGCMDMLYRSVENLDAQYLETDACKTMLLRPRNAAEDWCKCLALNMDDSVDCRYYICSSWSCITQGLTGDISSVKNVRCRCGKQLDQSIFLPMSDDIGDGKGVFVNETERYLISDDLHVMPASITNTLPLLQKLGAQAEASLGEKIVKVGVNEILYLLKRALLSSTALTDAFLLRRDTIDVRKFEPIDITESQPATETSSANSHSSKKKRSSANSKTINVNLVVRKSNKKVLCAEAQENLMDLLFSFLTFPLGSIIKLFGGNSCMGCVDHLYKSAFDLSTSGHIRSEQCTAMLLTPMLHPFFGCKNQLLDVKEMKAQDHYIPNCYPCVSTAYKKCSHGLVGNVRLVNKDPKSDGNTTSGGGFVKGPTAFMVTDELAVKMLSPMSFLSELKVPITDLDEQVVSIGEKEALNLLKASLLSKTALSQAFAKSPVKSPEAGVSSS